MSSRGRHDSRRVELLAEVQAAASSTMMDSVPSAQVATSAFMTFRSKPLANTFLNLLDGQMPLGSRRRSQSTECLMPDSSVEARSLRTETIESDTPCHGTTSISLETALAIEPRETAAQQKMQFTTVMLQNLPLTFTQKNLLDALDNCGLAFMYNFAYAPRSFSDGSCLGYAFINFRTTAAAQWLVSTWHDSISFCDRFHRKPLRAFPAAVQGLDALLRQPATKKHRRVRNPFFRPFVNLKWQQLD
mmetsp:Transcript_31342/g.57484  ORF Transcript_31342/g.57484 Transcript_31342/m.57484 type:complete len:246 (+) Transcript_31342:66-803(+)